MTNPIFKLALDNRDANNHNIEILKALKELNTKGLLPHLKDSIRLFRKDLVTNSLKEELQRLYDIEIQDINKAFTEASKADRILEYLDEVPKHEYDFVEKLLKKWNATVTRGLNITLDIDYEIPDSNLEIVKGLPRVIKKTELEFYSPEDQRRIKLIDPHTIDKHKLRKKLIKINSISNLGYSVPQLENALSDWYETEISLVKCMDPLQRTDIADLLANGLHEPNVPNSERLNAKEILTALGWENPKRFDSRQAAKYLRDKGYQMNLRRYYLVKLKKT